MSVQERDVLEAMSTVMDPDLNQDIVKAGMVKDLRIEGGKVSLKIELTTPACPMKEKIKGDAENAPASMRDCRAPARRRGRGTAANTVRNPCRGPTAASSRLLWLEGSG